MSTITDSLKNFYKKLGGSLSNLGPNSTSADIVDAMAEVYTDKEGTYVEVTEEVTEGTKIATIKTNNEDHDIYAPVELPAVTSADEGKVLSVDENGDWIADDVPSELPAVTSSDEGKVLTVDSNGDWSAATISSDTLIIDLNITSSSGKLYINFPDGQQAFENIVKLYKHVIVRGIMSNEAKYIFALQGTTHYGTGNKRVFISISSSNNHEQPYFYMFTYNYVSPSSSTTALISQLPIGINIPITTSSDIGKLLKVGSDGNPAWETETNELPAVTSADEGKVLSVDSNGDWIADDVPSELPTVTSSDEGKILAVDGNGDWVASDSNSYFDISATYSITSPTATSGIVGTVDIIGYDNWGQAVNALFNSGKRGRIIADGPSGTQWVMLESNRDGHSVVFNRVAGFTSLQFYHTTVVPEATYTDANLRLVTIQGATS